MFGFNPEFADCIRGAGLALVITNGDGRLHIGAAAGFQQVGFTSQRPFVVLGAQNGYPAGDTLGGGVALNQVAADHFTGLANQTRHCR